jgi:hypothetical protein
MFIFLVDAGRDVAGSFEPPVLGAHVGKIAHAIRRYCIQYNFMWVGEG